MIIQLAFKKMILQLTFNFNSKCTNNLSSDYQDGAFQAENRINLSFLNCIRGKFKFVSSEIFAYEKY